MGPLGRQACVAFAGPVQKGRISQQARGDEDPALRDPGIEGFVQRCPLGVVGEAQVHAGANLLRRLREG